MSLMATFGNLVRVAEDAEFNKDVVSPGFAGFIFTAFIALAVILLGLDLVRRLRRSRFREEIRIKLEAEIAERDAASIDAAVNADAESAVNTDTDIDAKP